MQEEQAAREKAALPYVVEGLGFVGVFLAAKWIRDIRNAFVQSRQERMPDDSLESQTGESDPST